MSLGLLVLCALSSYRIWRLLARDTLLEGPRSRLGRRWREDTALNPFYVALTCPWCLGSLISFAVVGGVAQVESVRLPGLFALAVAALVGLMGNFDG